MCYWCKEDSCKSCYEGLYDRVFEHNPDGMIVTVCDGDMCHEAKDWVDDSLGEYIDPLEDTFSSGALFGRCSAFVEVLQGQALVDKLNAEFKMAEMDYTAELGVWRLPDGSVEGGK